MRFFKVIFPIALFVSVSFGCTREPAPAGTAKSFKECTEYSCPTHPDRTAVEPETCPVCKEKMIPVDTIRDEIKPAP
jgi:hypothetical protein